MSEEVTVKIEAEEPSAAAAAAVAIGPIECIDLCDSDNEENNIDDNQEGSWKKDGDLNRFSLWARGSRLRERDTIKKKYGDWEDGQAGDEDAGDVSNVVTPRKKRVRDKASSEEANPAKKRAEVTEEGGGGGDDTVKAKIVTPGNTTKKISSVSPSKNSSTASSLEQIIAASKDILVWGGNGTGTPTKKISSASSSNTSSSSTTNASSTKEKSIAAAPSTSTGKNSTSGVCGKNGEFGAVGYTFHKLFLDNQKSPPATLYFHGEVVEILDKDEAVNGKDRKCIYEDGDVECMSLMDLKTGTTRCTDPNNCDEQMKRMLIMAVKENKKEQNNSTSNSKDDSDIDENDDEEDLSTVSDKGSKKANSIDKGPEIEGGKATKSASQNDDDTEGKGDDDKMVCEPPIEPTGMPPKSDIVGNQKGREDEDDEVMSNDNVAGIIDNQAGRNNNNDDDDDDGVKNSSDDDESLFASENEDNDQVVQDDVSSDESLFSSDDDNKEGKDDDDKMVCEPPIEPMGMPPKSNIIGNQKGREDENDEIMSNDNVAGILDNQAGRNINDDDDDGAKNSSDDDESLFASENEDNDQVVEDDVSSDESLFSSENEAEEQEDEYMVPYNDVEEEDANEETNGSGSIKKGAILTNQEFLNLNRNMAENQVQEDMDAGLIDHDQICDQSTTQYPAIGNPDDHCDDDNESACSRFSADAGCNVVGEWGPRSIYVPPKKKKAVLRIKKELPASLVVDFVAPPVERIVPDCYYLAVIWGKQRMRVRESKDPPNSTFHEHGFKYEIIYTKFVSSGSRGLSDDRMGTKYYKSYFLMVSGPGLEDINLRQALLSIADFESLTYERKAYKTVSRFDLMVSPCSLIPGDKSFCMYRLNPDQFEIIEDNGHLGCGFIPPELLLELLGKSAAAQRNFAIQVRIFGPSSIGIAKGMLVVKDGIKKIQVPTSMIKVGKSKTQPLHTDVVLNINSHFPSKTQWHIGRLMDEDENSPTERQQKKIKPICNDTLRVLSCKGVGDEVIENYLQQFKEQLRFDHVNLIGVSDPTGHIPSNHVFITGMRDKIPTEVFLTRAPCAEGSDGVVVKVASWQNMPQESFDFLNKLGFGAIIFPLGSNPLPPRVNDGDLDGDLYDTIWDEELINNISTDDNDEIPGECLPDDMVGMKFPFRNKNYEVIQKIEDSPARYLAATFEVNGRMRKERIEVSREQILDGTDCLLRVTGHRTVEANGKSSARKKKNLVEFHCEWASGQNKWELDKELKKRHARGAPEALVEYIQAQGLLNSQTLTKQFGDWIEKHIVKVAVIERITKHRTVQQGKIKLYCEWSDGDKTWEFLEDQKRDCKLEIGAYAKEKKLFSRRGWEETKGFWLEEVQDLMCKRPRAREIKQLFESCYRMWLKSFNELGGHDHDTIVWGRARKEAMKIEKHGGRIKLPPHLYYKLTKTLRENHAAIIG